MIYRIRINSFLYNQVNPVILSEIFIISRKMRLTAPYSIPRIPALSAKPFPIIHPSSGQILL